MKVTAISDLHGNLPIIDKPAEIMLIAGDVIPFNIQFNKYESKEDVKYRFWDARKKEMTYLTICFPKKYDEDTKIYLRDILSEKDGIKFSFILMRKILDTQVEG